MNTPAMLLAKLINHVSSIISLFFNHRYCVHIHFADFQLVHSTWEFIGREHVWKNKSQNTLES